MSNCRSGCRTKDHATYGECLKSANIRTNAETSPMADAHDQTKRDLKAYQTARANGIMPESTSGDKIKKAEQASALLGRPYNAEKDPPARMIVNKKTAQFTNRWIGE